MNQITADESKRLHNEPTNNDLGPCRCPICRPDLHGPAAPTGTSEAVSAAYTQVAQKPQVSQSFIYYKAKPLAGPVVNGKQYAPGYTQAAAEYEEATKPQGELNP